MPIRPDKLSQYKAGIHINYEEYEKDKAAKSNLRDQILKVQKLKSETKGEAQVLSKKMKKYFDI